MKGNYLYIESLRFAGDSIETEWRVSSSTVELHVVWIVKHSSIAKHPLVFYPNTRIYPSDSIHHASHIDATGYKVRGGPYSSDKCQPDSYGNRPTTVPSLKAHLVLFSFFSCYFPTGSWWKAWICFSPGMSAKVLFVSPSDSCLKKATASYIVAPILYRMLYCASVYHVPRRSFQSQGRLYDFVRMRPTQCAFEAASLPSTNTRKI